MATRFGLNQTIIGPDSKKIAGITYWHINIRYFRCVFWWNPTAQLFSQQNFNIKNSITKPKHY